MCTRTSEWKQLPVSKEITTSADIHKKAGPRGLVPCEAPAGWQSFVSETRSWGPSAVPARSQDLCNWLTLLNSQDQATNLQVHTM